MEDLRHVEPGRAGGETVARATRTRGSLRKAEPEVSLALSPRLLVLDGASHTAILAGSDSIIADVARERPAEGNEFGEICPSHQDYLWDTQMAKP